jgi:hypothetical protein
MWLWRGDSRTVVADAGDAGFFRILFPSRIMGFYHEKFSYALEKKSSHTIFLIQILSMRKDLQIHY